MLLYLTVRTAIVSNTHCRPSRRASKKSLLDLPIRTESCLKTRPIYTLHPLTSGVPPFRLTSYPAGPPALGRGSVPADQLQARLVVAAPLRIKKPTRNENGGQTRKTCPPKAWRTVKHCGGEPLALAQVPSQVPFLRWALLNHHPLSPRMQLGGRGACTQVPTVPEPTLLLLC